MWTNAGHQHSRRASGRNLAEESSHYILCRPHTTRSLSKALGVSVATVARALSVLRRSLAREGRALVSIKSGRIWRYEIQEKEGDAWESDPLIQAVGFATETRRPRGESVDEALYGRP